MSIIYFYVSLFQYYKNKFINNTIKYILNNIPIKDILNILEKSMAQRLNHI